MSVLASTNSFTIPLLPGVLLDLVQEFLHPRPGQPGLLDLLADCFEELVVFAQSPNYRRPANQRHFDIARSPQAQEDSESLGRGGTGLCRSGVGWPDGGNSATARRRRVPRSNQQEGQEDRADPGADAGTPGRGQEGRLEEAVS